MSNIGMRRGEGVREALAGIRKDVAQRQIRAQPEAQQVWGDMFRKVARAQALIAGVEAGGWPEGLRESIREVADMAARNLDAAGYQDREAWEGMERGARKALGMAFGDVNATIRQVSPDRYVASDAHVFAAASVLLHGGTIAIAYDHANPHWVSRNDPEDIVPSVIHVWALHETSKGTIARDVTGDMPFTRENVEAALDRGFPDLDIAMQISVGNVTIDERVQMEELFAMSGYGRNHPFTPLREDKIADAAALDVVVMRPGANMTEFSSVITATATMGKVIGQLSRMTVEGGEPDEETLEQNALALQSLVATCGREDWGLLAGKADPDRLNLVSDLAELDGRDYADDREEAHQVLEDAVRRACEIIGAEPQVRADPGPMM